MDGDCIEDIMENKNMYICTYCKSNKKQLEEYATLLHDGKKLITKWVCDSCIKYLKEELLQNHCVKIPFKLKYMELYNRGK